MTVDQLIHSIRTCPIASLFAELERRCEEESRSGRIKSCY